MTTKFTSVEDALNMGIYYAGSKQSVDSLKKLEDRTMDQFGYTFNVEVFEVINVHGSPGYLGVEKYRDGFALWLITPEGISQRV